MTNASAQTIPPTPKQVDYARQISARLRQEIPLESTTDRRALSDWIGRNQALMRAKSRNFDGRATSRQVAYAEKIARSKRTAVPQECFQDAGLMSRWIERNAKLFK